MSKIEAKEKTPRGAVIEGWLTKKGGKVSTWKKRWFVCTKETLAYYDREDKKNQKGEVLLDHLVSIWIDNKKPHHFHFIAASSSKQRVYHIKAANAEEAQAWITPISARGALFLHTSGSQAAGRASADLTPESSPGVLRASANKQQSRSEPRKGSSRRSNASASTSAEAVAPVSPLASPRGARSGTSSSTSSTSSTSPRSAHNSTANDKPMLFDDEIQTPRGRSSNRSIHENQNIHYSSSGEGSHEVMGTLNRSTQLLARLNLGMQSGSTINLDRNPTKQVSVAQTWKVGTFMPKDVLFYLVPFLRQASDLLHLALVCRKFKQSLLPPSPSSPAAAKMGLTLRSMPRTFQLIDWRPCFLQQKLEVSQVNTADQSTKTVSLFTLLPNGLRHGELKVYSLPGKDPNATEPEDEEIMTGTWDQEQGEGILHQALRSGYLEERSRYVDGKREGLEEHFYPTGEKRSCLTWYEGKQAGDETHWYKSGQPKMKCNWYKGKRHGEEARFHENGVLSHNSFWRDGKQEGEAEGFYDTGKKAYSIFYKNGRREGNQEKWHPNGQKSYTCFWNEGKKEREFEFPATMAADFDSFWEE